MDGVISTTMVFMGGVTSPGVATIGTWTVPVLGLANDLNIIMSKIQGGEKLFEGPRRLRWGFSGAWLQITLCNVIYRWKKEAAALSFSRTVFLPHSRSWSYC